MDMKKISEKKWLPNEIEYYTIIDERNNLLEMRLINPVQIASEVDVRYNLRPGMDTATIYSKEHCTNSMIMNIGDIKPLDLIPGRQPWVPYKIEYSDNEIAISQKGIGGGRERIIGTLGAPGVIRYELHKLGESIDVTITTRRYNKLIIGVDSTDSKTEGCTYYLAHNIAKQIEKKYSPDVKYLKTQIALLCIKVPEKTQNNSCSSISFAVKKGFEDELIDEVYTLFKEHSVSKSAYMTVFKGIGLPEAFHEFALKAKREFIQKEEAMSLLEKYGMEHREITGTNGIIGATAALGFVNDPENAAKAAFGK